MMRGALDSTPGGSTAALTAHAPPPAGSDVPAWRVRLLCGGLGLLGLVLAVRVIEIQWWRHAEFAARAARIQSWVEPVPARPGLILDRTGRVLAASTPAASLYLDPQRVADPEIVARRLASVLPISSEQLTARLQAAGGSRFLWVQRRLSPAQVLAVQDLGLPTNCYGFREEFQRHYPQGTIAAHVLGLRDIDGIGRGGLEEAHDAALRGTPGERRVRRDARGYVVEVLTDESRAPVDGDQICTTIDSVLQLRVEERLARLAASSQPKSCTAIVMLPESGEMIALASYPAFDPNQPQSVPAGAWKNQAVASMFEPGSTFKPLIVGWALDRGLLQRDELLHCGWGAYRMGHRVLHDHHAYGELSVTDVLVKSSNIGMARIGERLTNAELYRACAAFGFGRPTALGLPGELPGLLRPLDEWTSYSTGSIPMGQELSATPLQIITAHAALANGGRRVTPRLVRSTAPGSAAAPEVVAPILSPETAQWLIAGPMREVVTRGTGKEARIPGYSVFGKTGTAQVVDEATGRYSHDRHICSFICGAPVDQPRALVLVSVEEPQGPGVQYGGTVAAPVARDILQLALQHLGVPPDIPAELPPEQTAKSTGEARVPREY